MKNSSPWSIFGPIIALWVLGIAGSLGMLALSVYVVVTILQWCGVI